MIEGKLVCSADYIECRGASKQIRAAKGREIISRNNAYIVVLNNVRKNYNIWIKIKKLHITIV